MERTYTPLAERMRPKKLQDVIGQEHVTAADGVLGAVVQGKTPTSLILWGPPGTGKTTIARILANAWENTQFIELSAVTAGVKDVREVVEAAKANQRLNMITVLFVDEVHRFNKSQQDAFLPHIESGLLILIGATTENPSFEVNNALLSRTRVVVLNHLEKNDLKKIIRKATKLTKRTIQPKAIEMITVLSGGDARSAINAIEMASQLVKQDEKITTSHVETVLQRSNYQFDKNGEDHYNIASAFIKSMRGSDVEASLYYLHRLIAGGEDPKFIARRMVIFASEDIGMAAPYALTLAVAAFEAVEKVGLPEAEYALSHAALAMAESKKSRGVPEVMSKAKTQVRQNPNAQVPLHVRNAPTPLMKDLGYGKDYKWKADHRPEKGFMPKDIS